MGFNGYVLYVHDEGGSLLEQTNLLTIPVSLFMLFESVPMVLIT